MLSCISPQGPSTGWPLLLYFHYTEIHRLLDMNNPSQTVMGDKNPSGWGDIYWLGVIICRDFKELLVCGELLRLASELEIHKHFIWPLLIYAQNRILVLDAGFRLFIWRVDSLRPDNHEVVPFILTSRSVPQRVIFILDLANGRKRGWKAGKVGGVSVGEYMVHSPRLRCRTRWYVYP